MTTKKAKENAYMIGRRDLIKFSAFVGASLGLPRWKVFEVLEGVGGQALAAEAACSTTNRSVFVTDGTGSHAWMTQLWPHPEIAQANNPNFAWYAPGQGGLAQGTDKPLFVGPDAPFKALVAKRMPTVFQCGNNLTHTNAPAANTDLGNNISLPSAATALQVVNPTLVPVIAIGNAPLGAAPGAPRASRVNAAEGVVELFNSVASRAGGALDNATDANIFETHYRGFLALHRAAGRPTFIKTLSTGKVAANLLGKNLAERLRPTADDDVRYGINAGTQNKIVRMARALQITAKAFAMGLTSSVNIPGFEDDPHGAFNDRNTLRTTVQGISKMLDAFYAELNAIDDPTCAGAKIAENMVMCWTGDTIKDPMNLQGWPDGTPRAINCTYVLGAGYLRTGFHGKLSANGNVTGWDPSTGGDSNLSSAQLAAPGGAAVLYAIAKGDVRRVQDFYRGDIKGVTIPQDT